MAAAILAEGITKTFARRRPLARLLARGEGRVDVLRGVDLEVRRGEVFGLLGSNGSGKTTLLEVLAARLAPTGGSARVAGRDVLREPLEVRRIAGYCPAGGRGIDLRLDARENLRFFAALGGLPAGEARSRVERLLRLARLEERGALPAARFSDGERQRLCLARALLLDPPVLLLDEPTRALDPEWARQVGREVLRMTREEGTAVLLVTHREEEALLLCDRAAFLAAGRIVRAGAPGSVLSDASHLTTPAQPVVVS